MLKYIVLGIMGVVVVYGFSNVKELFSWESDSGDKPGKMEKIKSGDGDVKKHHGKTYKFVPLTYDDSVGGVKSWGVSVSHVPGGVVLAGNKERVDDVSRVISDIDGERSQYKINVTLIVITNSDSTNYGLRWLISSIADNVSGWSLEIDKGGTFELQTGDFTALAEWASSVNHVKISGEPSVSVIEGRQADLVFGESRPILDKRQETNQQGTESFYSYRDIGITLKISVRDVVGGNSVIMDVQQASEDVTDSVEIGGDSVPVIASRRVSSVVRCKVGRSIVIGGLKRSRREQGSSGVPLVSSVPGLGRVFKSSNEDIRESELVVMLTPVRVR